MRLSTGRRAPCFMPLNRRVRAVNFLRKRDSTLPAATFDQFARCRLIGSVSELRWLIDDEFSGERRIAITISSPPRRWRSFC